MVLADEIASDCVIPEADMGLASFLHQVTLQHVMSCFKF